MDSQARYQRTYELFVACRQLPPEARERLLTRECADDPRLRGAVERTLAAAEGDTKAVTTAARDAVGAAAQALLDDLAPTAEPADAPPRIGRFVILRVLGSGGMGVVYLGYDNELDRRVAIKVLRDVAGDDGRSALRLRREAQSMARVAHPNVLQIHEVGSVDGQVFIVMEFVAGETLRARLTRSGPPQTLAEVRERLALFLRAGEGLAAAHRAGIIHRDFKPDNVLLGDDGRILVADFGLARAPHAPRERAPDGASAGAEAPLVAASITRTKVFLGTPGYMPPEQRAGQPLDARADIYAFCVSLYEALHGRRPPAQKPVAAPSPAEGRPYPVPRWLLAILDRGLRRDREARWSAMDELLLALRDDLSMRRRRRWRLAGGLALTSALAAAGAAVVRDLRTEVDRQSATVAAQQLTVAEVRDERDVARERAEIEARRARDLLRMAVLDEAADDPTTSLLVLAEVEAPSDTPGWQARAQALLSTPVSAAILRGRGSPILAAAFFGSDQEHVVVQTRDGLIRTFAADGRGAPRDLDLGAGYESMVRVGDDRIAAPIDRRTIGIWRFTPAAADPWRRLWVLDAPFPIDALAVDPRGRRLVASGAERPEIALWDLESGAPLGSRRCGDGEIFDFDVAADGALVLVTPSVGPACLFKTASDEPPLRAPGPGSAYFLGAAPSSAVLLQMSEQRVWTWTPSAKLHPVTPLDEAIRWAVAPQGTYVATNSRSGDVRLYPHSGAREPVMLGPEGRGYGALAFSPDDAWLASGDLNSVVVRRTDDLQHRAVLALPRADRSTLVFSDDGSRLLAGTRDGDVHVWELTRLRRRLHLRAPDATIHALAGADDTIAALADASVRWWPSTGRDAEAERFTLDGGVVPGLSDDGACGVIGGQSGDLHVRCRDGRSMTLHGHDDAVWDFDFAADQRRLISASEDATARVWDLDAGAHLYLLRGHDAPVWSAALDAHGARAATFAMDGSLRLWELADESEPEATLLLPENPEGAASGSFSPDDRFFLARLRAPGALLWDLHATEPVATRIPTGRLADACWSPDGRWFATATRDGHVLTWDPRRPLEPLTARELSQTATLLACSPDGRWLAASAGDDSVELWPSLDAARVERHRINGGKISALAFDASSRHLLLGTEDGTLSRWTPTFAFDRAPERVREQLRAASTACLSEQQRRWILLELPERARVAAERCERSYARLPAPP